MHNSKGKPTHATFAFCRTINKLIKQYNPKNIIVVWDSKGGSTSRIELFPEYKATRDAPPNDLFEQKEDIIRFLETINMSSIARPGYEADDIIASLAKDNKEQTVIVCADKDLYQLLSEDDVLILDTFKDKLVSAQSFEEEKEYSPSKIPFFYAMLGDKSDNIPGVAGVGKKTAEDLVKQFDSLDDMYANLEQIAKARPRKLLEEQKENAYLSLKLFLCDYLKIKLKKNEIKFSKKNIAHAYDFFKELELKSLLQENIKLYGLPKHEANMSLFDEKKQDWTCTIVSTVDQLKKMIAKLEHDKICGMDTETTGPKPLIDELVGMSFASDNKEAFYIPLRHPYDEKHPQIDVKECLDLLKPLLTSSTIKKTLHNTKFDELVMWNAGYSINNVDFDTLIAACLVKEPAQRINLKALSLHFFDEPMRKFKHVMGKQYKHFSEVPINEGAEYGAHDALQTFKLRTMLSKILDREPKLKNLFETIDMPLMHVLTNMEKRGMLLDATVLEQVGKKVVKALEILEGKIYAALPAAYQEEDITLNLRSPKQIEELLFVHLGLPTVKKSPKGARSTDQEVLRELSKVHPVPGMIIKHRELTKLNNTYIEPLPKQIIVKTGRVHTSFSQTFAATGRLSSNEPNLQNIPASGDYGLEVRKAFIAPKDHLLLSADYSQIELRVLAHLSGDENLITAFKENKDIHAQTAAQLFNLPLDKITTKERQIGKRVNFGIVYGQTPFGLSKELGIKQGQAREYIDKYFEQYPSVKSWMQTVVDETLDKGYCENLWGRRRHVPEIYEKNRSRFELGKRIAINTVVQSTAADLIKMAMIELENRFNKQQKQTKLLLQIHDELLIELHQKDLPEVESITKSIMEEIVSWKAPIKVSIRSGKNWFEITK